MTNFKHALTLAAASLVIASAVASAQTSQHPSAATKGSTVTLMSCVEKAQNGNGDKLVLTHVADVPAHPAPHGRVVYWIEKVDQLKPHIGHQVRLTGKVTDVEDSEIDVKLNDRSPGGAVAEIEGHGTEVKTMPDQARVSTQGQTEKKREIPTTVVTLALDKVEMVAATCKLAQ